MTLQALEALYAIVPVIGMIEAIRRHHRKSYKTASVSKRLHKYVDPCMKRYGNQAYCWRVAWSIYCSHVNPKYPGCTRYGKTWGKPYSKPISER